jgi:signal transduction histidine kinase
MAGVATTAIDSFQTKLNNRASYAVELLEKQSNEEISIILQSDAETAQLEMEVVDIIDHKVIYRNGQDNTENTFYGMAMADYNGRKLLIKVFRPDNIGQLQTFTIFKNFLYAEGIIVAFLMILLGFVFHYLFVKPLLHINSKIYLYRKNKDTEFADVIRKDELGQIEREFYRFVSDIKEERQLQSRIIASISHDVKTPLTSVMGYVERLRSGKITDSEKTRKYLNVIYDRAQDIKDIIGEFDEYLASNADSKSMNLQRVTTERLCGLLAEEYTEELAFKAIGFHVENRCINCSVYVDINKMRRVFGNIIGNAVKYAKASTAQIKIICEYSKEKVIFMVSDNGPGIPEEELENIFEAFYTLDSARGGGSGLGLSICKRIVEAHNGLIYARKSEPEGLEIIIELPGENNR